MANHYQEIKNLSESLELLAAGYKHLHEELEKLRARKVSPDTHEALMFWAHSFLSYLKEIDPNLMDQEQFLQAAQNLTIKIKVYQEAVGGVDDAILGLKNALDTLVTSLKDKP